MKQQLSCLGPMKSMQMRMHQSRWFLSLMSLAQREMCPHGLFWRLVRGLCLCLRASYLAVMVQ